MQGLRQENEDIRRRIEGILQQIEKQKELNAQHQSEIETLLKFNERLLGIIETQLNNKKDTCSLQPISERSERESDLIGPAMNSLLRSKKLTARSERGGSTRNSLVEKAHGVQRLAMLARKENNSELNKSYDKDESENPGVDRASMEMSEGLGSLRTSGQPGRMAVESDAVKEEMNKEIAELKRFRNESTQFYDAKIKEVKGLSSKLGSYEPGEQLKKISDKLTLSPATNALLKNALSKKGQ